MTAHCSANGDLTVSFVDNSMDPARVAFLKAVAEQLIESERRHIMARKESKAGKGNDTRLPSKPNCKPPTRLYGRIK